MKFKLVVSIVAATASVARAFVAREGSVCGPFDSRVAKILLDHDCRSAPVLSLLKL